MKCKTMSNVIHKPVPSKFSCPVAINRPGILIPNGPPRYRPPPQPQQTKQSYVVEQDEKRTVVTSEQLNAFTTATDVNNRIPRSDTSSNTGSDILHQLQHTIAQSNTTIDTQNMLKFVRKPDVDSVRNANGQVRRMAIEIRNLKEANQRLSDDNQELRDLCCFLDDDRQKGRKLAREWQRFGRYTASVMRQEVSAYQAKLRELDIKQHELIKDNLELKELCLYLDEERNGVCRSCGSGLRRDDGDGSSSSTNADDISHISAVPAPAPQPSNMEQQLSSNRAYSGSNDNIDTNTAEYIRRLEMKIKQLENEKQILLTNMKLEQRSFSPTAHSRWKLNDADYVSRPEAVVQALQVLEVREQLEGTNRGLEGELNNQDMDEGERALLREMCNVVWRKLEEASQQNGKR